MSTFVFANNVNTTLAGPISGLATSLTLSSSANLPTLAAGQIMALTLNDAATQAVFEVVYVTAISGAVCTVTRGQEGTTSQSWLAGDYAYASVTKGVLQALAGSGSSGGGTGYVILGNGVYLQWATIANVAADGSAAKTVSFPVPFPTACFGVGSPTIINAFQTNPWALGAPQVDTVTTTGFNVNVQGAPAGSVVSIFYTAIGN